jgi:hypothetical protein
VAQKQYTGSSDVFDKQPKPTKKTVYWLEMGAERYMDSSTVEGTQELNSFLGGVFWLLISICSS